MNLDIQWDYVMLIVVMACPITSIIFTVFPIYMFLTINSLNGSALGTLVDATPSIWEATTSFISLFVSLVGILGFTHKARRYVILLVITLAVCSIVFTVCTVLSVGGESLVNEPLRACFDETISGDFETFIKMVDIQSYFHCCGFSGYLDYANNDDIDVPQSCCEENSCDTRLIYDKGCSEYLLDALNTYVFYSAVYGCCAGACFALEAILLTVCLVDHMLKIRKAEREDVQMNEFEQR